MKYRAEIDGLRALAVIPVILFHAGFTGFSGGFVGVDIFFVISGYLITNIIMAELNTGQFSIVNFYERRARRILPALFFVILACLPFAWFILMPRDLADFAQSIIAVTTFSSNILFWLESGYFETAAELKPLLHTWSLAVEEQYYIVFPLLLMLLHKFSQQVLLTTLLAIGIASLITAELLTYHAPEASFFLLPSRGWELLLGASASFYLHKKHEKYLQPMLQQLLALVGLALILVAIFTFSKSTPTPSLMTMIPTLGALLIILFARNGTYVQQLLSTAPMVGVGLISYSAYLWHQPIFAFFKYRSIEEPTMAIMGLLSIVSFILAAFSWKYVEAPFRNKRKISKPMIFATSASLGVALITLGFTTIQSKGFSERFQYDITVSDYFKYSPEFNIKPFQYDDIPDDDWIRAETIAPTAQATRFKVLVLGDSHAGRLKEVGRYYASKYGVEWSSYIYFGCPPVFGHYRIYDIDDKNGVPAQRGCRNQIRTWEELVKSQGDKFDYVVLASRWNILFNNKYYGNTTVQESALVADAQGQYDDTELLTLSRDNFRRGIKDTLLKIQQSGAKAVVFEQAPRLRRDPIPCLGIKNQSRQNHCMLMDYSDIKQRGSFVNSVLTDQSLFDQHNTIGILSQDTFCDTEKHSCMAYYKDTLLYKDAGHIGEAGALLIAKRWEESVNFPFGFKPRENVLSKQ